MEVIGLILFIVFMFIGMGDKKKKGQGTAAQQARARAAQQAQARAAQQARTEVVQRGDRPIPPAQQEGAVRTASAAPRDFGDAVEEIRRRFGQAGQAAVSRESQPVSVAPAQGEGRAMLEDDACRGGSMPHVHAEGNSALEDEDCFGGSMEHTHTEGVSRVAHARRMAAIDSGHGDQDMLPETIDARALRRAVVMAEVLGKPRAMRPRL